MCIFKKYKRHNKSVALFLWFTITSHNAQESTDIDIRGMLGGAKVLGKLPVPGRPTNSVIVGQGPIALPVSMGKVIWTFFLSSFTFLYFLPLCGRRPDID